VLRAWDRSVEGALYLDWLVEAHPELDAGLVLREAVLEWADEEPVSPPSEKALAEFCARLAPARAGALKEKTAEILAARAQIAQAIRGSIQALRKLRRELGCGRLEALNKLAAELEREGLDESQAAWGRVAAIPEVSARVAALRRTTTESPGLAKEWQGDTPEELDRYYSYQLANRLEQIVERASGLEPLQLKVASEPVKALFQAAHEVYLYGFDVACIALCRGLIDHALKDKLAIPPSERPALRALIDRAHRAQLLEARERDRAERVEDAGNKAMHNLSDLRRTAQEVLGFTRMVLNKLYAG